MYPSNRRGPRNTYRQRTRQARDMPVHEYPVFLVHSNWTLKRIRDFLSGFGNGNIGSLHIDRERNGNETNRTICLMDESIFEGLNKGGYSRSKDFSINRYELRQNCYPSKTHAYSFYIPVPAFLSEQELNAQLDGKFGELVKFGILKTEDYKFRFPEGKSFCFVTFDRNVDHDTIAIIKVCVDNTWWYSSESPDTSELMRCFWGRRRPVGPRDSNQEDAPIDNRTEKSEGQSPISNRRYQDRSPQSNRSSEAQSSHSNRQFSNQRRQDRPQRQYNSRPQRGRMNRTSDHTSSGQKKQFKELPKTEQPTQETKTDNCEPTKECNKCTCNPCKCESCDC